MVRVNPVGKQEEEPLKKIYNVCLEKESEGLNFSNKNQEKARHGGSCL